MFQFKARNPSFFSFFSTGDTMPEKIYVITYYSGGPEGWTQLIWAGTSKNQALKKLKELQEIARTTFEWFADFLGLPPEQTKFYDLNFPLSPDYIEKQRIFRNFMHRCDPTWTLPYWDLWEENKSNNFTLSVFNGFRFIDLNIDE